MIQETPLRHTQIGIFNPGRLSDEEIERAFISRIAIFQYLFEKIISEKKDSIPQHHIIIGQRGMGKSTLLHRIAVELRKVPHKHSLIPLTFPEEQYNVDRLSKFWLNCLDALGDALDKEGNKQELDELDRQISIWSSGAKAISPMEMYRYFDTWCQRLDRRAVLLVDNLNLIFDRLSKEEQHELRAVLMRNGAPILVGASATTIEDTVQYSAPFYDAFQMKYLKKLSFEETMDILRNLAQLTGNQSFLNNLYAYKGRLAALYHLTGGTPRTVVMLYPLIQDGFSIDVQTDIESLMDVVTPLYKARFEELPPQMQVIMDAVALHWDPIHLQDLRSITHLENAQLAPQLKRLTDVGWLQRLTAYKAKGNAYEISERFFNIWYLMRRSSRRQKKELLCLTKFLVSLYGDDLHKIGRSALEIKSKHPDQISVKLAIADGLKDKRLAKKLKDKSYEELFEFARTDRAILSNFYIPKSFINKKEKELFEEAINNYDKHRFQDSFNIFLEIIRLNQNNEYAWYNLGVLYQNIFSQYSDAEGAYKRSIELNSKISAPWVALGDLYRNYLNQYIKSESAYKKAISIDGNWSYPWYGLGGLYRDQLSRYFESELAYKQSIALDANWADAWNALGGLYHDYLNIYTKAEEAYKKAISLDKDHAFPKLNLIFLYRDKMNRLEDAKAIFEELAIKEYFEDSYWLNATLFALYDKNVGTARDELRKALEKTHGNLPVNTRDDWWRFAAVASSLGHAQFILDVLKEGGYDITLKPYYIALQATLEKDSQAFLNSIAVEVREPAAFILEKIKKY